MYKENNMTSVNPMQASKPANIHPPLDKAKLEQRLAKARTSLVLENPFFGTLAMNMKHEVVLDGSVGTACTNGKRVLYEGQFLSGLSDDEVKFLVAHEIGHPMLLHIWRRMGRDPKKWNIAGNYVINELLVNDSIGTMIEGGYQDTAVFTAGGGTTDGIYDNLPDNPGGGGAGDPPLGGYGQDIEDDTGNMTEAEINQQMQEGKIMVAQAAQAAKMAGKLSAGLERLVGEVLEPVVDWREVLQQFVVKCKTDERSWARPNRRLIPFGLYLPSRSGEQMGELAFMVDCSGSIGQKELDQFTAEIRCVKEDHNPTKIHVLYFDTVVSHYETYGPDDELDIRPHGGGGTAFAPCFEYLLEHDINPVACVFLTDLYCYDFGEAPACPVLWVTNGAEEAPFGQVVKMVGM